MRTLFLAFICFMPFIASGASNQVNITTTACEGSYGFEPACYEAWRDRELGATFNGNVIYNIYTDCPKCSTGGLSVVVSQVDAGTHLIYGEHSAAFLTNFNFSTATPGSILSPGTNALPTTYAPPTNIDSSAVCIVHDPFVTRTIVEHGNIDSFLGITNWVDESLRERFLVEHAFANAGRNIKGLMDNSASPFSRPASQTNSTAALQFWEQEFKHKYSPHTNMEGLVRNSGNEMLSNGYFGGSVASNSTQSTNGWGHGGSGQPGNASVGSAGNWLWQDIAPNFGDTNICRDPNFILFIGIPQFGIGDWEVDWWQPGGIGGSAAQAPSGLPFSKKVWINFDPVKLRMFRVIGHFIYITLIWLLFYFGVQFKVKEFKEWYLLNMAGDMVRATNVVGANTLLASLNPVAIGAGGVKVTADKVAWVIVIASLASFLVGTWYTYQAFTQANPTSTSTVASGWFHAGHSTESEIPNTKSLLASALDLAQFVVPFKFLLVLIVELWIFRSVICGFVLSYQSVRNWLDI